MVFPVIIIWNNFHTIARHFSVSHAQKMEYVYVFGVWRCKWKFWGWNLEMYIQYTFTTIYTLHRDTFFLQHCLWKSIITFTPSNSIVCGTLQNTPLYEVLHRFSAVHCSAFLYSFVSLALASLCTDTTWALRFSLQLSLFRWNPIYRMVSPYESASWTASLTLHLNFHSGTSGQSFSDFFIENF